MVRRILPVMGEEMLAQGKPPAPKQESLCGRKWITSVRASTARNTKQAIAIGLSKARRAGVKLKPPAGRYREEVKRKAEQDLEKGEHATRKP